MLGRIEGRRRRGQQRMRWLDGFIDSIHMGVSKLWEIMKDREAWYAAGDDRQESCSSAGNCQADEQTVITQLSRP